MLMKHKGNMGNSHDMFLIFNQGRQMPGSFSVGLGYCGPMLLFGNRRHPKVIFVTSLSGFKHHEFSNSFKLSFQHHPQN